MANPTGSGPAAEAKAAGAKAKAEVSMEELQQQIAILKDDIATITKTLGDFGKARAQEAKNRGEAAYEDAVNMGKVQAEALGEQASRAISQAEERVRENPTAALGIAAGIGFVLGMISAKR